MHDIFLINHLALTCNGFYIECDFLYMYLYILNQALLGMYYILNIGKSGFYQVGYKAGIQEFCKVIT